MSKSYLCGVYNIILLHSKKKIVGAKTFDIHILSVT